MSSHEHSDSTPSSASTVLPFKRGSIARTYGARGALPEPAAKQMRSNRFSFTKSAIGRMRCEPGQAEAFFWDAGCNGFGMRALNSGRRSWIYQYRDENNRTRRLALGDVSAVSLDSARAAARHYAATVTKGGNPALQRKSKRRAASVLELVEAYLLDVKGRQRPRSYKETERHLRKHVAPLHYDRVDTVQRRDITTLLDRVSKQSGPIAANRVRAALSALWTWGLRTGRINADSNPVTFTLRQPEKSRERTLSDAELKSIWQATDGADDYSRIVRLCLLTGCRREEIGGLRWQEVQGDHLAIGSTRMKGSATHEIALLPMINETLPCRTERTNTCVFGRRGTGFSGWSKSKRTLDSKIAGAASALPQWTLHDLRRTFSTRLHDAGVNPIVIEALLAHKQQGVAGVYNRASFRVAKRAALERWHSMIRDLVEDDPGCIR